MSVSDPGLTYVPQPGVNSGGLTRFAAALGVDEILATLWRRKVFIVCVALAVVAAVAAARQVLPRHYSSSAQLAIDTRGLAALDRDITPRDATSDGRLALVNTQMQVLVSDSVLAPVVKREKLAFDPEFNGQGSGLPSLSGALKVLVGFGKKKTDRELVALNNLKDAVGVILLPGSFVVSLSVTTESPQKSKQLVDAITSMYIEQQGLNRRAAAQQVSDGLDNRLEQLRARVRKAEDEIEQFKNRNNIIDAGGQLNNEQQLTELTNQLGLARTRSAEMRARYEMAQTAAQSGAGAEELPEAVKSQTITELRSQYAQVKRQADSMAATHGPRHPNLQEMRAQARSIAQQISQELNRIAAAARRDYEQARATELDLSKELSELKSQSNVVNQSMIQLRQLQREAQASRAVYESFLTRAREVREQRDIDTTNIKVISPALLPLKADGPPTIIVLFIAAMMGLSLGSVLAVAREALSGAVISPQGMTAASGLPVAGVLPLKSMKKPRGKKQAGPALPVLAGQHGANQRTAAALRQLHERVREHGRGIVPHCVLVAPMDGSPDGAATALNLALAADQAGQRVLLVDFDRSEALMSRALGGPAVYGLDTVLSGYVALQAATYAVSGSQVCVLPQLPTAQGDAFVTPELVQHRLMAQATGFDLVIFLSGQISEDEEFAALASLANTILVTVRAGRTRLNELELARHALGHNAGKVAGAAFLTEPAREDAKAVRHAEWSPQPPMQGAGPAFGQAQPSQTWHYPTM